MSGIGFFLVFCLLAVTLAPVPLRAVGPVQTAPAFDLAQQGGGPSVRLADLRGRIVVLDFFAYWCVPCVRASAEMETGIGDYYHQRGGNAHGIPVVMLAVNTQTNHAIKTDAFIQRTGLKQVLDDPRGAVFERYGGTGLPFLVVIDATGGKSGLVPARIVYQRAGFEGITKLREVIDSIGGWRVGQAATAVRNLHSTLEKAGPLNGSAARQAVPNGPASTKSPEMRQPPGAEVLQTASLDFATMLTSGILLTDEQLEYRQTRPNSEFLLSLSHGYIGLKYEPESALEKQQNVDNDRYGFQARGRLQLGERIRAMMGGGAYDGYMDYRSLWFNEHFRQLFSMRAGYESAHPWGCNVAAGVRWEYLPSAGFLGADITYQHDVISPGYEVSLSSFPPQLVRFRSDFDTVSGQLRLENVLARRLRTLQELQVTATTDRSLRFALQSSLNYALAEHWVARLVVSGTEESPHFLAGFADATVEWDWNNTWFLSLMARCYQDNGEVENALLAEDTADPPLQTFEVGLGLRWQGQKSSFKLFAGPYFTRYEQIQPAISTFPHLYQNRSWLSVQFAFAHEF